MNINEAKMKLEQLNGRSKFETMLGVCTIFTKMMNAYGLEPIIVGGFAVEIYSRSEYTTVDIDLVFSRRDLADKCFQELGFSKEGRHWYHEKLGVSIEIPGDMLESADRSKVIKLNLPEEDFVYVIGLEDIILDRLRACVHWKSTSDCEWGSRLLLLHEERLDMDYVMNQSDEDKTKEKLNEWLSIK